MKVVQMQAEILQQIAGFRTENMTLMMSAISQLASPIFIIAVIAALYWCVDKEKSRRWGFFVLFSTAINSVLKQIIKMPRPYEEGVVSPVYIQKGNSYAFPSGHTQAAVSFWGGAMYLLRTKASIIIGSLAVLFVGFSRLYLGVHWPMDVIGGIFFGILSIITADLLLPAHKNIDKNILYCISGFVIIAILFNVGSSVAGSIAALWGLLTGVYLEEQYIQFETAASKGKQIIKLIIGYAGMGVIYVGIAHMLPEIKEVEMLKNALVLLWTTAGAPCIFKKLKWQKT